ncbi:thiamine pyrophosphate-binding protein [Streptomyces daghestanicus]|uniref:Acetolactate synthase n=1 Tax=Streptomyces daghestanicus TaxID=66885 RepID=A0ABQ3Q9Z6_9ACTN|nr:thiamine pyrophosphate-binding protein [Streptomyces daghestanicus]GGU35965.1 acetolactate synthase [Streptomyces daghestanicus]GHI34086.1 acetolactate synthase [Streptomyces daghestanicus]
MTHDHDLVLSPTAAQTEAALNPPAGRTGTDLVVETLAGLGAATVFGVPGRPAPGTSAALDRSGLRYTGLRTEHNAACAADAYGRITGEAAPLLLPAGPGALGALTALQEARAASAPVLAIGSGAHADSFRGVVKSVHTVRAASGVPSAVAEAWRSALTAPHGPVWVDIPQDVLAGPAPLPVVTGVDATPEELVPRVELTAVAADLLTRAARPAIVAGGGVVRADAARKLRQLAERLDAPVATTSGGAGAFPRAHPLSLRSWPADRAATGLLEDADVLLVVGAGLDGLPVPFRPRGRLIQIEADPAELEARHPALGIHADARLALQALLETAGERTDPAAGERVRAVRDAVRDQDSGEDGLELRVLAAVRRALPSAAPSFWDPTPLTHRAWAAFDAKAPGLLHSARGGGPGYAFPAALGAATADPTRPVLAVSGTGAVPRSVAELATARQYALDVTWLIVDDDDQPGPDLVALAVSFGVLGVRTSPEALAADLAEALAAPGPAVVHLPVTPRTPAPAG